MKITTILLNKRIVYKKQTSYCLNRTKLESIGISSEEMLFISLRDENSPLIKHTESYQLLPICNLCSSNTEFVSWNKGYKNYCSDECRVYIRTKTIQNRTAEQKLATNNKRKQTKLERYGDENFNNTEKIVETQNKLYGGVFNVKKSKETKLARYGNESYNNTIKQQQTMEFKFGSNTTFKIPELRNDSKREETNLKKYGVLHPLQNNEVYQKALNTKMLKYGNPNYVNPEKHKDTLKKFSSSDWVNMHMKRLDTISERYGDSGYINLEKRNQTNIERYGVANISQASLNTNAGYRWKEYKLPSGKIIKYQGYEDKLLDKLLERYDENDIITSRGEMPEFWYIGLDNKKHRYFPDVYIPKTNTIYEVKSEYTLNINLEVNKLKFESVIDSGYKFELTIF